MARTIGASTALLGVLGTVAMGVATVNKFQTLDQAGITDRSYRLAHVRNSDAPRSINQLLMIA
jgi:hypothetical protein